MKTLDVETKLFIALAIGRTICGLCAVSAVLFTVWLVQTIGQSGVSINKIAATAWLVIITTIFAHKAILDYSADHPYWVLIINTIMLVIDGVFAKP